MHVPNLATGSGLGEALHDLLCTTEMCMASRFSGQHDVVSYKTPAISSFFYAKEILMTTLSKPGKAKNLKVLSKIFKFLV